MKHFLKACIIGSVMAVIVSNVKADIFCVEGLIGAGKSTLIRALAECYPAIQPVYEPIEQWQNVNGQGNLLLLFSDNPHRWSFSLQLCVMQARFAALMKAMAERPNAVYLVDHSLYFDYYCFALPFYQAGYFDPVDWVVYSRLFESFVSQLPRPRGFIYLRTSPEKCIEHIAQRQRADDIAVGKEFLDALYRIHEEAFIELPLNYSYVSDVPHLIIDGDYDYGDEAQCDGIIAQVSCFIDQHHCG